MGLWRVKVDEEAGVRVGVGNRGEIIGRDVGLCTSHLTTPQREESGLKAGLVFWEDCG